ncbi:hypothetical protein FOA52_013702 [Chlamydomonas sp. UWO 241]|nr:hypothetical protein FOA52_013702 [Chlamydomonas sp. UWO 241]
MLLGGGPHAVDGSDAKPTCKPQGWLQLDQPYPVPMSHSGGLPFCPQFPCTCCNHSHALLIQRTLQGPDGLPGGVSPGCAATTALVACRVCDPEVGTGAKPAVCTSMCDRWLSACANDFFGFEGSGNLVPCTEATADRLLVCSRLKDLAPEGGAQLCALADLVTSEKQPCYSGAYVEPSVVDACAGAPVAPLPKFTQRLDAAAEAAAALKAEKKAKAAAKAAALLLKRKNKKSKKASEGLSTAGLGLFALVFVVIGGGVLVGMMIRAWRSRR